MKKKTSSIIVKNKVIGNKLNNKKEKIINIYKKVKKLLTKKKKVKKKTMNKLYIQKNILSLFFFILIFYLQFFSINNFISFFFKQIVIKYTNSKIINFLLFNDFTDDSSKIFMFTEQSSYIYLFHISVFFYLALQQTLQFSNSKYSFSDSDKEFFYLLNLMLFMINFLIIVKENNWFIILCFANKTKIFSIFFMIICLIICKMLSLIILELNNKFGLYRSVDILALINLLYLCYSIKDRININFVIIVLFFIITLIIIEKFFYLNVKCYKMNDFFYLFKREEKKQINIKLKPLSHNNENSFLINNIFRSMIMYVINAFFQINESYKNIGHIITFFLTFIFTFVFHYMNMSPSKLEKIFFDKKIELNYKESFLKIFIKLFIISLFEQIIKIIFTILLNIYNGNEFVFTFSLLIRFYYNIFDFYHYFNYQ